MGRRPSFGLGDFVGVALFDTHAFVKRLTAVGMPEAQAEVLADEQARVIDERLATKDDLKQTELRLEAKITAMGEAVKAEIVRWMFGTIGFQTLIILGAVVALARVSH